MRRSSSTSLVEVEIGIEVDSESEPIASLEIV